MSWLGAAIGAGASLLGNIFNRSSQNSANSTNMRIAQMNNQWSEEMMQKQMDYNTDMWNKNNKYNSASEQRRRLEQAGLNPSLMMNGGSAGVAQAASSPGLPSPAQAAVQPNRYDFSGIGQAIQNAYIAQGQRNQMDANTRFLNTQADWYAARASADISKIIAETKSHTAKTYWQNVQNQFAQGLNYEGYMQAIRNRQSTEVSIHNAIKQGVLMDKQIARYDDETNARIADMVASTALKYSQGQLSKEQLRTQIEQTKGLKLSNKEKDAIFDYVIDQADAARFKGYTPWSIAADAFHGVSKRINNWLK